MLSQAQPEQLVDHAKLYELFIHGVGCRNCNKNQLKFITKRKEKETEGETGKHSLAN
jgi:hypothetical protein